MIFYLIVGVIIGFWIGVFAAVLFLEFLYRQTGGR